MAATVVCISRTDGAAGKVVGAAVASDLRFRYVDQEIVDRAAEKANVDSSLIADAERRKSFVRRLLDALPNPTLLLDGLADPGHPSSLGPSAQRPRDLDVPDVVRSVIGDLAEEGRVVIVSHAASLALAGAPNVLRVLVTASPAVRIERVSRGGKWLQPSDAAAAVREADRNRQDYLRRFYEIDREEPTHYDLVVSTDVLTPEQAAAIICAGARIAGS